MSFQTIKTPGGETLVVLPLDEYEDLRDAADYAKAKAARRPDEELLSVEEALAHAEAPTPLHFWRRKRDLTQAALAKAVGISQSYLADIERGARKGDPELYKKLARELNVRMEDLVAD
jgi:DNA-binding XRE family transcriptional regulator